MSRSIILLAFLLVAIFVNTASASSHAVTIAEEGEACLACMPPDVTTWLASSKASQTISAIEIHKAPLTSIATEWLSVGGGESYQQMLNSVKPPVETMYHVSLKITLSGGDAIRLEKLQIVSISDPFEKSQDEDIPTTMSVNMAGTKFTLPQLFSSALASQGATALWVYDPFTTNCQAFAMAIMTGTGRVTPAIKAWVLQNMTAFKSLGPDFVDLTTDIIQAYAEANLVAEEAANAADKAETEAEDFF